MTLLTIAKGLALNVGLPVPAQVYGSPLREMQEIVQMANETGEELARRVQWGALTRRATIDGEGQLPQDFGRLTDGVCAVGGGRIVRPITRGEWNTLPPQSGTPRYFLLEDNAISTWPNGTVAVSYQTRAWCDNGRSEFTGDEQRSLIDEDLFLKGLIARWRRQKGMPYADEEAEFEASLAQYAQADDRSRF